MFVWPTDPQVHVLRGIGSIIHELAKRTPPAQNPLSEPLRGPPESAPYRKPPGRHRSADRRDDGGDRSDERARSGASPRQVALFVGSRSFEEARGSGRWWPARAAAPAPSTGVGASPHRSGPETARSPGRSAAAARWREDGEPQGTRPSFEAWLRRYRDRSRSSSYRPKPSRSTKMKVLRDW